jgi:8-oxo-dGTP pyrophosphatase MutT (NUDIX family)
MPRNLHNVLLSAVSPFDEGVRALKVSALRDVNGSPLRPNRTAAILVPVVDKHEPEIILTVRSAHLAQHPGQVSFPGGSVDQDDRSAVSTALREAEEEIGLGFSQVSPLGFLDRLDTISDYRVLPVVGLVKSSFVCQPNHQEVAEVFSIPLDLAIDHNAYSHKTINRDGESFLISSLNWQGHRIWGVTAAILLNLANRINGSV